MVNPVSTESTGSSKCWVEGPFLELGIIGTRGSWEGEDLGSHTRIFARFQPYLISSPVPLPCRHFSFQSPDPAVLTDLTFSSPPDLLQSLALYFLQLRLSAFSIGILKGNFASGTVQFEH